MENQPGSFPQASHVSETSSIYPSRYQPTSNMSSDPKHAGEERAPGSIPQQPAQGRTTQTPSYAEPYQFGTPRRNEPVYHEIKET